MRKMLVFLVVGIFVFGACSVQNANAQNIERSIIGTWVCHQSGQTWTFDSKGVCL